MNIAEVWADILTERNADPRIAHELAANCVLADAGERVESVMRRCYGDKIKDADHFIGYFFSDASFLCVMLTKDSLFYTTSEVPLEMLQAAVGAIAEGVK